MNSPSEVKARASKLRELLVGFGYQLKHTESLEVISKLEGYADWNTCSAYLKTLDRNPGNKNPEASSTEPDHSKQPDKNKLLYCSFCGKSQHEVLKLVAGPSVFICDVCVDLCNDIITEEMKEQDKENKNTDTDK